MLELLESGVKVSDYSSGPVSHDRQHPIAQDAPGAAGVEASQGAGAGHRMGVQEIARLGAGDPRVTNDGDGDPRPVGSAALQLIGLLERIIFGGTSAPDGRIRVQVQREMPVLPLVRAWSFFCRRAKAAWRQAELQDEARALEQGLAEWEANIVAERSRRQVQLAACHKATKEAQQLFEQLYGD